MGLVVIYHFWPQRLPGGFIGVDVFFVISGFLITSHLIGEHARAGRIDLPRFWARRARRLLPASLLVLAVTAAAIPAFLPEAQWQQALKEVVASALYVENWVLAADSVDYLAAENAASPVQHFWSLSVEEQFYIFVPILLVLAGAIWRRRRAMWIALAALAVGSFAYSIWATYATPGSAYFATTTRGWEFAAGGLLAFVVTPVGLSRLRAALAWLGWTGIVAAAFVYSDETAFPGYTAALPVLATLAVIWAGSTALPWSPERLLAIRPATFLGDISYSVYLWHWPVVIFAGLQPAVVKVSLIVGVIGISWLSWRFVEKPVRRVPVRRPRYTFALAAGAMAIIIIPAAISWGVLRQTAANEVAAAQREAATVLTCFGAAAEKDCVHTDLVPRPASAADDKAKPYGDGCIARSAVAELRVCEYGVPDGDVRVALIGDSHAVSWLPTLEALAADNRWSIATYFKSGCPHSSSRKNQEDAVVEQSCADWNSAVDESVINGASFDVVFVTHSAAGDTYDSPEATVEGFQEAWQMFTSRGTQVVVIRDTPRMNDTTLPCLERSEQDPDRCAIAEADSLLSPDWMVEAAQGQEGVTVIDVTDVFCWNGTCKAAVGGVVAYRDQHHLTETFAITLAPILEEAMGDAQILP